MSIKLLSVNSVKENTLLNPILKNTSVNLLLFPKSRTVLK